MLDIGIVIILIFGFLIGLKRGFILQLIHMIGLIIAFITAFMYYDDLAPKLRLWIPYPGVNSESTINMVLDGAGFDEAFYRAIAFAIIFLAVRIVLAIIGSALDIVASLPILRTLNIWAGGILGFLEIYLLLFVIMYIAALLPIENIQVALNNSILAQGILEKTPYFSNEVHKMWFDYIQK
ncbi:CvpA family protein [Bacillus sp. FSL K6-3431]|uniref:CvpA family protein n=1 Tax=Bacillus sp. FSL K6-3431 TaxID=2921500 RepID=UPI0030F9C9A0